MWYRTIIAQIKNDNISIDLSSDAFEILQALSDSGKQGLVVGGSVRDALMGLEQKDIDIEVYGFLPSQEFLEKGKEWDVLSEQLRYTDPKSPEYQELKNKFEQVKMEYNNLSPLKDLAEFLRQLPQFGKLAESEGGSVGKSFGVIKFRDNYGNEYDFSLPRTESKTGAGHTGFRPVFGNYSPKEAAARRDFTFNSMAFNPLTDELHDYFGGQEDLRNGIIRHTSPAFKDDPLRVLRGMQFSSRLGFDVAPETAELCKEMMQEFKSGKLTLEPHEYSYWNGIENVEESTISRERIAEEFMKLATKGKYPSKMLNYLVDTGWIEFFTPLKNIVGLKQDLRWHPEGTLDVHTGQTMDHAVQIADEAGLKGDDRAALILAAMAHDFGKAVTTITKEDGAITSHEHDMKGGPIAEEFLTDIGIKKDIIQKVRKYVESHMRHISLKSPLNSKNIHKLADDLAKGGLSIKEWEYLTRADHKGIQSEIVKEIVEKAEQLGVLHEPLKPLITGRDFTEIRPDIKPGPVFGVIIQDVLYLQKAGRIKTREEALEYLKTRVNNLPPEFFASN